MVAGPGQGLQNAENPKQEKKKHNKKIKIYILISGPRGGVQ